MTPIKKLIKKNHSHVTVKLFETFLSQKFWSEIQLGLKSILFYSSCNDENVASSD